MVQQLSALIPIYILTTENTTQKQQEDFMLRAGFEYGVGEQYFWDLCKQRKNFLISPGKGQPSAREIPVSLQSLSSLLPSPQVFLWLKFSLQACRTSDLRVIRAVALPGTIMLG